MDGELNTPSPLPTDQVIDLLVEARRHPITGIDLSRARFQKDAALSIQLAALTRLIADGDKVGGWKVSYTSGRARDLMGQGYRPFGFLLESRILPSRSTLHLRDFANLAVEPELCLELGSPLSGAISPDEARNAVRAVAPSFELNETRYVKGADDCTVLADGCGGWGIVLGDWRPVSDYHPPLAVELRKGSEVFAPSNLNHPIDDPFLSLARLSAYLDTFGWKLKEGDRIITGSFSRAVIEEPSEWTATFPNLGDVNVVVVA